MRYEPYPEKSFVTEWKGTDCSWTIKEIFFHQDCVHKTLCISVVVLTTWNISWVPLLSKYFYGIHMVRHFEFVSLKIEMIFAYTECMVNHKVFFTMATREVDFFRVVSCNATVRLRDRMQYKKNWVLFAYEHARFFIFVYNFRSCEDILKNLLSTCSWTLLPAPSACLDWTWRWSRRTFGSWVLESLERKVRLGKYERKVRLFLGIASLFSILRTFT